MKLISFKERRIRDTREQCIQKREAILEKLGGRNIKDIAPYETDSFYALYSELARLSSELAEELPADEGREYAELSRLCDSRTELIKKKKYKK